MTESDCLSLIPPQSVVLMTMFWCILLLHEPAWESLCNCCSLQNHQCHQHLVKNISGRPSWARSNSPNQVRIPPSSQQSEQYRIRSSPPSMIHRWNDPSGSVHSWHKSQDLLSKCVCSQGVEKGELQLNDELTFNINNELGSIDQLWSQECQNKNVLVVQKWGTASCPDEAKRGWKEQVQCCSLFCVWKIKVLWAEMSPVWAQSPTRKPPDAPADGGREGRIETSAV